MGRLTVLALVLMGLSAFSGADRLLTTPTGKKIPQNAAKLEFLSTPSRDTVFGWIGYGVTDSIELEVYGESFDSDRITPGVNLSYNYLTPITDLAPGISVGVMDIADQTVGRRTVYAAITYYFGNWNELNQDTPTVLTMGGWSRDGGGFFFNFSVPFTNAIRFIGEHDGGTLTAGLEYKPFEEASLKYVFREGSPSVGFSFQKRF